MNLPSVQSQGSEEKAGSISGPWSSKGTQEASTRISGNLLEHGQQGFHLIKMWHKEDGRGALKCEI